MPLAKHIGNAELIGRHPEGPISNTYALYKDMHDNNVIYSYKGIVTSDLVGHVLGIMEERLEDEGTDTKVSKKVFNVMVESLNNVYADEEQMEKDEYDPSAMLMVKKFGSSYTIVTGSYIPKKKVPVIKQLVDHINELDHSELKAYYQEVLSSQEDDPSGITQLGILDLAKKSRNVLLYNFKYINTDFSFFSLEATIDTNRK